MSDDEDASNRSKSDTRFQWIKDRILNVMRVKADALMKMMAEEENLCARQKKTARKDALVASWSQGRAGQGKGWAGQGRQRGVLAHTCMAGHGQVAHSARGGGVSTGTRAADRRPPRAPTLLYNGSCKTRYKRLL